MSGDATRMGDLFEGERDLFQRERDPFERERDLFERELDLFDDSTDALERLEAALPRRLNADPEGLEKGLAQLVLTLVELLRQLMERQALRRIESGTLTEEEIERLGRTFLALSERMDELKRVFGLEDEDLNLNLGPLGNLM